MNESVSVILSLGSNEDDRLHNLARAIKHLKKYVRIEAESKVYITSPVDYADQQDFFNQCVSAMTALSAETLLDMLLEIEDEMGRKKVIPKGPRIIDIDIIYYGRKVIKTSRLSVPHPAYRERLFVLKPLLDIYPDAMDPETGEDVRDIIARQDFAGQKIIEI